ncbi:DUF4156 domain-containing protein [Thioclava sp. F36-6]|uniref:DUF4156 domain-containing protein n=1 Tax=Thioclava sp. F36-6 TaxID=1915316 RepID=UPI000997E746|nr:DUF4156 domain-containing protein [Thioclava sp. F36-6]OOY30396.1 hypothetical protein BMI88_14510 [Thioclava sp. F36-6]
MKRVLMIGVLSLLSACVAELSPEAQLVRQVSIHSVSDCRFLGPVSGSESWGMGTTQDAESALNKLRNKVAALGGNAFVQTNSSTRGDGTVIQGDAYFCR